MRKDKKIILLTIGLLVFAASLVLMRLANSFADGSSGCNQSQGTDVLCENTTTTVKLKPGIVVCGYPSGKYGQSVQDSSGKPYCENPKGTPHTVTDLDDACNVLKTYHVDETEEPFGCGTKCPTTAKPTCQDQGVSESDPTKDSGKPPTYCYKTLTRKCECIGK